MSPFNTSSTKDQIQEVMAAMNNRPFNFGKQIALRLYLADLFLVKFLVSVSSILWGVLLLIPSHVFTPEYLASNTPRTYRVALILIALGSYTILPNFKVLGKTRLEKLSESMSFLILSITWTYLAAISYDSSGYLSSSSIGYVMLTLLSALVFIRYGVHET